VVLVTTELNGPNGKEQRGLTVSSFTTICLTPAPFICFSTRQNSRAADLIAKREHFIVHLLPCTPGSARIAEAFSKSDLASQSNEAIEDPFKLGRWDWNDHWELPVLSGVLGALHCKVEKFVKVGDHRLCIAEVEDIFEDESAFGTALSYCGRKYRKEGEPILMHDSNSED
jgi:flavin reductase (DIM6/NTAB) family NADH-FMN oxidoreductase RutF